MSVEVEEKRKNPPAISRPFSFSFSLSLSQSSLSSKLSRSEPTKKTHSSTMGRNLELPIAEPFLAAAAFFSSSPSPPPAPPSTTSSFRLLNAAMAALPAALRSTEACLRISMGPASSSRGSLPVPGPKACSPLPVEDESRGESRGGVWRRPICIRP